MVVRFASEPKNARQNQHRQPNRRHVFFESLSEHGIVALKRQELRIGAVTERVRNKLSPVASLLLTIAF